MPFPAEVKFATKYKNAERQKTLASFKKWLDEDTTITMPKKAILCFVINYAENNCLGWRNRIKTKNSRASVCESIFSAAKHNDQTFLLHTEAALKTIENSENSTLKKSLGVILNDISLSLAAARIIARNSIAASSANNQLSHALVTARLAPQSSRGITINIDALIEDFKDVTRSLSSNDTTIPFKIFFVVWLGLLLSKSLLDTPNKDKVIFSFFLAVTLFSHEYFFKQHRRDLVQAKQKKLSALYDIYCQLTRYDGAETKNLLVIKIIRTIAPHLNTNKLMPWASENLSVNQRLERVSQEFLDIIAHPPHNIHYIRAVAENNQINLHADRERLHFLANTIRYRHSLPSSSEQQHSHQPR